MGKPVEITDQTFEREVFSYPGTALVDFWAPWCTPCRMVAPVLEDLALKYNGRVKIAKINVDQNPVAASRFQVQSIPTLIIFKNGKAVDRIIGALPGAQIEARLQAALES
ncbi:MAG: thioredoxin [Deltaproteobacteria bacterium]|nr:MAG: thioredoxin [Deltaproteobacteria bacterium]